MAGHGDELAALRAGCTRFLHGHGWQDAAQLLGTIPADTDLDRYGEGGAVAALEADVGGLLGKAAAEFEAAARRLAGERGIWAYQERVATADPGVLRLELSVGDATCALEPAEIRGIVAALAGTGENPRG